MHVSPRQVLRTERRARGTTGAGGQAFLFAAGASPSDSVAPGAGRPDVSGDGVARADMWQQEPM